MRSLTVAVAGSLLALALGTAQAAPVAGEITLLTGKGTAASPEGAVRNLAKGARVYPGESLSTGPNSYLNVKFTDGGLVLLRPNTRFQIEQYVDAAAVAQKPVPVTQAKAAVPVQSGPTISKVAVATFGKQTFVVEGMGFADGATLIFTDVTNGKEYATGAAQSVTATRIAKISNFGTGAAHWQVKVRNPNGEESWPYDFGVGMDVKPIPSPTAVAAASAPAVTAAPVATAGPVRQTAVFKLLKGGFRTVTGLIGKADRGEYRVSTRTATIGIRGTDYEVILCDAACASDPVLQGSIPGGAAVKGGTVVGVISGGVFVASDTGGNVDVGPDQYVVTLPDGSIVRLPFQPRFLKIDPIPNPASCQ